MRQAKGPPLPDFTLLGLLWRQPMHGYELHQHFREDTPLGRTWTLGLSQLYAALKRLEERGLIAAHLEWEEHSHPPRKVYHLTPAGERAFYAWLTQPVASIREIRLEFLSKLYFAAIQGPELAAQLIARQEGVCQTQLARWQQALAAEAETADPLGLLVVEFRIGQFESILRWLARCREVLLSQPALSREDSAP